MKTRSLSFEVSPSIGSVSAECMIPDKPKCIMSLAHGAGAGMNHIFMVTLSRLLAEHDIATMRFNFPFTENKKGRPDTPVVAHHAIEAAASKARELLPGLPLIVAGKSFGGRMSSQYLSANPTAGVNGIVFYGFPLHQPGKPATERADHLKSVRVPKLFLQGTRDALADWEMIKSVCLSLSSTRLVKLQGADHSFKAGKQNILQLLADHTNEWFEKRVARRNAG